MKRNLAMDAAVGKLRSVFKNPYSLAVVLSGCMEGGGFAWVTKRERAKMLEACTAFFEAVHGPDHPELVTALSWLGDYRRDLDERLAAFARAYSIAMRAEVGEDYNEAGFVAAKATGDLAKARRLPEAYEWARKCLEADKRNGTDAYWDWTPLDKLMRADKKNTLDLSPLFALEAELAKAQGKELPADYVAKCAARKAVQA